MSTQCSAGICGTGGTSIGNCGGMLLQCKANSSCSEALNRQRYGANPGFLQVEGGIVGGQGGAVSYSTVSTHHTTLWVHRLGSYPVAGIHRGMLWQHSGCVVSGVFCGCLTALLCWA
jgi:hypothetical protein